jgi:hypothetical protein
MNKLFQRNNKYCLKVEHIELNYTFPFPFVIDPVHAMKAVTG